MQYESSNINEIPNKEEIAPARGLKEVLLQFL